MADTLPKALHEVTLVFLAQLLLRSDNPGATPRNMVRIACGPLGSVTLRRLICASNGWPASRLASYPKYPATRRQRKAP